MYLTVTLNPALDKIISVQNFTFGALNPIEIKAVLAAGRGVDVAKVLRDLGHPVTACGFLGENHRSAYERLFLYRGINGAFTHINGQTRSNLYMIDETGRETELLEPSPEISAAEWKSFSERLCQLAEGSEMVIIGGSVPQGITEQMFDEMLTKIDSYNLPMILDTKSDMIGTICRHHPKLLTFNREKISQVVDSLALSDMIEYAASLRKDGAENTLISLDKDGALLVAPDGVFQATAPAISVKSSIGSGGAMMASFAESFSAGRSSAEALRYALAVSCANCLTMENAKILKADYDAILPQIKVQPL